MWLTPWRNRTSSVRSAAAWVTCESAAAPKIVRLLLWPVRPNAPCGTLIELLDRPARGTVEQVQAPHVDAKPHAVTRAHTQVGIDPRRDRVAAHRAVQELVRAQHLGDLDFEVEPRMALARVLRERFGPDAQDALLDARRGRQLELEASRLGSGAVNGDRNK